MRKVKIAARSKSSLIGIKISLLDNSDMERLCTSEFNNIDHPDLCIFLSKRIIRTRLTVVGRYPQELGISRKDLLNVTLRRKWLHTRISRRKTVCEKEKRNKAYINQMREYW